MKYAVAIFALVAGMVGWHFARRALVKHWPAIWRLIDLRTPPIGPPCPNCGYAAEVHADVFVCEKCGEVW